MRLVFAGLYGGGPIQSIATLTKQLENDVHFKIITTDRDFRADKAYDNVVINKWTTFEGREVFYVSPENMNPGFYFRAYKNHTARFALPEQPVFKIIYPVSFKMEETRQYYIGHYISSPWHVWRWSHGY